MPSRWGKGLGQWIAPLLPRPVRLLLRRGGARHRLQAAGRWPVDPDAGPAPREHAVWPAGRRFALVLMHDVDSRRAVKNCLRVAALERWLGFRSSFNLAMDSVPNGATLRQVLVQGGFEVGLCGSRRDRRLCRSGEDLLRVGGINRCLAEWGAVGFRMPAATGRMDWLHRLAIEYDASASDTELFGPRSGGVRTVFPFRVCGRAPDEGYVELPCTMPDDLTLFVLLGERDNRVWQEKLAWIAGRGGMVLLVTHPGAMSFGPGRPKAEEYPAELYDGFLRHVRGIYEGMYWQALPREVAALFHPARMEVAVADPSGLPGRQTTVR